MRGFKRNSVVNLNSAFPQIQMNVNAIENACFRQFLTHFVFVLCIWFGSVVFFSRSLSFAKEIIKNDDELCVSVNPIYVHAIVLW